MDADFMAAHIFFDQELGTLNDTRTDDEESSLNSLLGEVVKEVSVA